MTSVLEDTNKLRRFLIEIAKIMQTHYKFREIAELFYRSQIIDIPENPYPNYEGSKYDYAMEKLSLAKNLDPFLSEIVPEIFGNIDIEYGKSETRGLVWAAEQIGYKVEEIEDGGVDSNGDHYWFEYRSLVPPDKLLARNPVGVERRIYIKTQPNYPKKVISLIEQLNNCLSAGSMDSSALTMRRIIFLSSVIYAKINQFEKDILDKEGNYQDLSKILEVVCSRCPDVTSHLTSRIKTVKWMGDYANHNKNWSAKDYEISMQVINLRAYLNALFP